jgi:hypothetical protein
MFEDSLTNPSPVNYILLWQIENPEKYSKDLRTKLKHCLIYPFTKSDILFAELVWREKMLKQIGMIFYETYYALCLSRYSVGLICTSDLNTLLK